MLLELDKGLLDSKSRYLKCFFKNSKLYLEELIIISLSPGFEYLLKICLRFQIVL